uniref:Gag-pol polyprotein n=1 Tax=Solanum tuberosum TaxID=4113 RepID=M1DQG2_SOLTU
MLGKCNVVGSDNSSLVNEAMAFFSNNKCAMPRSSFNPNSGSNPHSGAVPRSSHKSSPNSHLYCGYCNWKGHVRSTCYKLHGYPADWKGATGIVVERNDDVVEPVLVSRVAMEFVTSRSHMTFPVSVVKIEMTICR